jgi:hypothetical protein
MEGVQLLCNDKKLFEIGEGSIISFIEPSPETPYEQISIKIPKMVLENMAEIIPLVYAMRKNQRYSVFIKYSSLNLID